MEEIILGGTAFCTRDIQCKQKTVMRGGERNQTRNTRKATTPSLYWTWRRLSRRFSFRAKDFITGCLTIHMMFSCALSNLVHFFFPLFFLTVCLTFYLHCATPFLWVRLFLVLLCVAVPPSPAPYLPPSQAVSPSAVAGSSVSPRLSMLMRWQTYGSFLI